MTIRVIRGQKFSPIISGHEKGRIRGLHELHEKRAWSKAQANSINPLNSMTRNSGDKKLDDKKVYHRITRITRIEEQTIKKN